MRKSILLFHPRTFHEKNYRYYYVPYSLLSVASTLDRSRYEVVVVDNNVDRVDDWAPALSSLSEPPLCVGISSMVGAQIKEGIAFGTLVHELWDDVPVVWGGGLATVLPELTAGHPAVDVAVQGQGQETFAALVDAFDRGGTLAGVEGVSFRRDGHVVRTPARKFADWNGFPPFRSVYDLVDVSDYVRPDEHINARTVNYHSSQGCPFSCGFCSEVALWNHRWSGFTADRIVEDVEFLVSEYGIDGIKFYDAEFFIRKDRVLAFAEAVVQRGLDIRWAAAVHPKNLNRLDDDEMALISRSGASRVLMGAESGVQEELDLVKKGTSSEMLLRLARRCSEYGIHACFSFVTGYPGSSVQNIERSLEFAAELLSAGPEHEAKVHFFAPYPGTPLYQLSLDHGFDPPRTLEEWADYDYYYITTPWVDRRYEAKVREFNEDAYPYLHGSLDTPAHSRERLCPIVS
jgi:anaerobic magnesium-protoporphyrin IX monomethyl ester cyclase